MDLVLQQQNVFPALTPSFGGSSFWVQLPANVSARKLEELAAQNIIINAANHYLSSREGPGNFCRLGYSSIPEERIDANIDRLAGLVRQLSVG